MSFWVRFLHVLAAILLVVAAYALPGRLGITETGLDCSYPLVIEDAANHHAQFGKDTLYTLGPLGYLFQGQGQGLGGYGLQRWLFAGLKAVFSAYVCCRLLMRMRLWMRVLLWCWLMAFPPSQVILCAGIATFLLVPPPLLRPRLQLWEEWILPGICGLAALVKFTDLMSGAVMTLGIAGVAASRRQFSLALRPLLSFGLVFLALWLASGQALQNLPEYLRNSLQIATGFATMTVPPTAGVLAFGIAGLVALLAGIGVAIHGSARRCDTALRMLPVAGCLFLSWKHGFVRADEHVAVFFSALGGYGAFIAAGNERQHWRQDVLAGAALVFAIGGMVMAGRSVSQAFTSVPASISSKIHWHVVPASEISPLLRTENSLPLIRQSVGHAPVDITNYQQAFAFLNDLNLRPRPVFQSFIAATPELQRLNLAFYQSDLRPDFVMFRPETIDRRWPWLDDAPLALHLLTDWTPVVREKGFILMKPAKMPGGTWKKLFTEESKWEKKIVLPGHPSGTLLALQLQADRSVWGKLKRFAYQGANLDIKVSLAEGSTFTRNFVPEMAVERVLLSPSMESVDDILAWQTGLLPPRQVAHFRLMPWKGGEREFTRGFHYTLWQWTPSTTDRTALAKSLKPLLYNYLPSMPELVKPALPTILIDGAEFGNARVPSHIQMTVPPEALGIEGRVHLDGAGTDDREEVLVRVVLRDPAGKERTVYEQHFGNLIEKTYDLKVDLPPGAFSGLARQLVLEATSNSIKNRAHVGWGSFAWRTVPRKNTRP